MLLPLEALCRPAQAFRRARVAPSPWPMTLFGFILPWLAFCAAGQLLGLKAFPPALPPEGVPVLSAYAIYSALTLTAYAAGVGWTASLLAEAFDGRIDADAGFVAVAAAALPAGLAKLLSPWPLLHWLALPLLAWAVWLLYRGLGDVLRLPEGRLPHFFVSVVSGFLIALAVGWQLRDLIPGAAPLMRMGRLWLI